ncbi:MAG: serine/threonine-protein phosphatase [Nitrospira sp.]|nr:serine/threonine-protein phosphatase [Nitrospira sp.]
MEQPSSPTWRGTGLTHIGLVRSANQDAFAVLNPCCFWIVADGMGGRAGGEVASRLAIETIAPFGDSLASHPAQSDPSALLREAIQTANRAIRGEAVAQPGLAGMGTTVVALHIAPAPSSDQASGPPAQATIAHLGDSRAYLLRDRSLTRLTKDHSWVEEQIRQGLLSPEEARTHPSRHLLAKALGTQADAEPDIATHFLQPGDRLLLCTDGLTKMLDDGRVADELLLAGPLPQAVCQALIERANQRGGEDNTTVVVIDCAYKPA